MKYNRTKNATRNIRFGLILKIYQTAMPFLIRTLFIYIMGVQYLGLNSLFTSILSVLSLAELGVGNAMVYSMYKPLAEDDNEVVCALMRLYKIYYRIIGSIVLVIGLIFVPLLPYLIKDDLPADVDLYVLYLMNLAVTVLSYWLFAYKNCIINANQRVDIISKISLVITSITYAGQIAVLLLFHNYYLYIVVCMVTSIASNIITAVIAERMFPQFKAQGKLSKEAVKDVNKRIRDLFTSKLGTVIIYSVDTIVISAFLGLTILAKYQNYYFIFTAVAGFVDIIFGSLTNIVGNSIVSESKAKNYDDFKIFMFIISWIAGFCSVCLICLYQPFMELWVGKELMLEFGIVICFGLYFFIFVINKLLNMYKDASGMWHSDRFRPLVIAFLNLGLNIISVQYIGLYGIILSTIFPMVFVGYTWLVRNLCHEIFMPDKINEILKKIFSYSLVSSFSVIVTYYLCSFVKLPISMTLIVRALICIIVPNILFFFIYSRSDDFQNTLDFVNKRFLKGRFEKIISAISYKKKERRL